MNQSDLLSRNIAKALAYRNDMLMGLHPGYIENGQGHPCHKPPHPCPPPHPYPPPHPCPGPYPGPYPGPLCPLPCPPPGPPGPPGPTGPVGPTTAIVFDGGTASTTYVGAPTFDCGSSK